MLFNIRPKDANFNFVDKRHIALVMTFVMIFASIISIAVRGLNFGIDFSGGIVLEIRTEERVDMSTLRGLLTDVSFGEVSLQEFGQENDILIRMQSKDTNTGAELKAVEKVKELLATLPTRIEYRKVDYVGPQVGTELIQGAILSLLLSFAAIMVYVWLRFEWQFGVGAILALVHDAFLTLGLYSVTGIEFNLTSVAAILTIIGYSINDSVVIYDRIRECMRKFKKMPLPELINLSVNQTLSRTILTGGTTLVVLLALIFLGGEVIYGFSVAVFFGILIGTYSSIYISAPVLIYLNVNSIAHKDKE